MSDPPTDLKQLVLLVLVVRHQLAVLAVLDLLGYNVMQELHGVLLLHNRGEVSVGDLLVIAVPLGQLGQVHDE